MISSKKQKVIAKQKQMHEIPVEYGGVSVGDETARLSLRISRESLNIIAADELLCGRRLAGSVQLGGLGDCEGQSKLFDCDVEVGGTFDVHRFGVSSKHYSTGLTFKLKEINIGDLAQFSKGSGRLCIAEISDIPHDVADDDNGDKAENKTLPGTFATDLPWKKVSLDTLFRGVILKSLKGAGLSTVGDLHEYQQPSKSGHINQLSDIKGLGVAKVTEVEDRMIEFWRDNKGQESD